MLENVLAHTALLIFALLGPIVEDGTGKISGNAKQNGFIVWIKPPDDLSMRGQYWPGVCRQEIAEVRALWLIPLAVTAPFAWAAADPAMGNVVWPLVALVAQLILRLTSDSFDLFGTRVEIIAAQRAGLENYMEEEAARYAGRGSVEKAIRALSGKVATICARLIYPLGYRVPLMEHSIRHFRAVTPA